MRWIRAALLGGLVLGGTACSLIFPADNLRSQPPAEELDRLVVERNQAYAIGPRDVLNISVWDQPDLSVDRLVVRLDGKISFPLLDDIQAAGLTPTELKAVISERLNEFVTSPYVTVVVVEINSKIIYVIGEVASEGPIVYLTNMRVIDALSTAGGFNAFAGKRRVKIIREYNGSQPTEFLFDYEDFVRGEDLSQNILLLPGDRIVIPPEKPFPW